MLLKIKKSASKFVHDFKYDMYDALPRSEIKSSDFLLIEKYIEINHDSYSFQKLNEIRIWFEKIFSEINDKEGWFIGIWENISNQGYRMYICQIDVYSSYSITDSNNKKYTSITLQEAFKLAKQYGWKIDDNGIVLGFDKRKLKKYKHLISAHELNLL